MKGDAGSNIHPDIAKASSLRGGSPSGRPGEFRRRDPRLPLVLDAEGVDPRARCLGGVELRRGRMADTDEPDGLSRLNAEGHDVLDLEVDRVNAFARQYRAEGA